MAGTPETPIPAPVTNFSNTKCVYFNGSNSSTAVNNGSIIPSATGMSYSCWVKSTNYAYNPGMKILEFKAFAGAFISELTFNGSLSTVTVYEGGLPVTQLLDPIALSTGIWHHLCVTSASTTSGAGTITLYVDGTIVDSGLGATLAQVYTINVGGGAVSFYGQIDEVAVWDTQISSLQVAEIYNGSRAYDLGGLSVNLKIWWRMGDFPLDREYTAHAGSGLIYNVTEDPDKLPNRNLTLDNSVTIQTDGPPSYDRFQVTTPENSGTGLVPRVLNQKAVTFDGVDQSYSSAIGLGPDFTVGGTGMTLTCYVKFNSAPTGNQPIFGQVNISTTSGVATAFMIYASGTTLAAWAVDSASGDNFAVGIVGGMTTGTWYQVTVTLVPGGYMTGYVWGNQYGTPQAISAGFGAAWSANRCWSIGAWRYGAGTTPVLADFSDIQVDECAVIGTTGTHAEIVGNYAKIYARPDWSTPPVNFMTEFEGKTGYPLAWWRMGDTAGDSATRMFDATGTWGNEDSAAFDGIDDGYISDASIYRPANTARSLSWWMKPNSPGGLYDYILDFRQMSAYHRAGVLQCGGYGVTTLVGPSAGSVWAHFVFTISTTNMFIYKNGVEVASSSSGASAIWSNTPTGIGSSHTGTNPWPGNIDEVCFWEGTALSEANALEIYNTGSALDMATFSGTAPTNWYRMGDDAGDSGGASGVLVDQMGSLDFSAIGAPVIEEDVPGQSTGNTLTGSGLSASDIQDEIPIIYLDTQAGGPYFAPPTIITPIQVPYVNPVPVLASSSPPSGVTDGGTTITITGINLNGVISVVVGGVFCTSPTSVSATSITAVTSANTAGIKDIIVTTAGGYGTLSNAFTYAFDTKSAYFNATDEYFSVATSGDTPDANWSMSLWVKIPTRGPPWPGPRGPVFIYTTGGFFQTGSYGANHQMGAHGSTTFNTTWTPDTWEHYALVNGASNTVGASLFYKNGSLVGTGDVGYPLGGTGQTMWVGRDAAGSNYTKGGVDEIGMWTTTLSALQVAEVYNQGGSGTPGDLTEGPESASLIHYYRMGDTAGDSSALITDLGSRGEDLAGSNDPPIVSDVPPT